ncbi:MAG: hypothetical protein JXR10_18400, partial [Cyclobacteriaceae bacterium]
VIANHCMDEFEIARKKYRPDPIKYLLIAETPPKSDSNRFFYFEDVDKQDSLFLETMKVLYPHETLNFPTKIIRQRKREFLNNFKEQGFYLIDSLNQPFEQRYSSQVKINKIIAGQTKLLNKLKNLIVAKTPVILISATVYRANFKFLVNNGINVVNSELIDFPGSGGQKKYREKMTRLLEKTGYNNR